MKKKQLKKIVDFLGNEEELLAAALKKLRDDYAESILGQYNVANVIEAIDNHQFCEDDYDKKLVGRKVLVTKRLIPEGTSVLWEGVITGTARYCEVSVGSKKFLLEDTIDDLLVNGEAQVCNAEGFGCIMIKLLA